MTLQSSGAISLANVNTELGRASTTNISLGETAVRTLAGVASGTISLSNLYGKSSYLDQQTVTVGIQSDKIGTYYGFQSSMSMGSISDGTFNVKSGATITEMYYAGYGDGSRAFGFTISGIYTNDGWTTINANGTTYSRSAASFTASNGLTTWYWNTAPTNPFGDTSGATKVVTFT